MITSINDMMCYATKWQVNSAQWQAKRRLGVELSIVVGALKAQVNTKQYKQINLGFQPAISMLATNPRLRHWAELKQAFSPNLDKHIF